MRSLVAELRTQYFRTIVAIATVVVVAAAATVTANINVVDCWLFSAVVVVGVI